MNQLGSELALLDLLAHFGMVSRLEYVVHVSEHRA
jgi:hypothetical protein